MSIIRRFSFIIPSLTRHLYNEQESVYIIISTRGRSSYFIVILIVVLIKIAMQTPPTIPQISEVSTLLVTLLLFIELQCTRLPLISKSLVSTEILFTRIIRYLIQELKSLLFTNNLLTNINSFNQLRSRVIYLIPLSRLLIYYSSLLFII